MKIKTKIQEYFYTLKACKLRWFVWFLPLWVAIPVMQQFGSTEKFKEKYVNATRLGNSGLFFIFSQEIQNRIRENIEKNHKIEEEIEKEEIIKKYKGLGANETKKSL